MAKNTDTLNGYWMEQANALLAEFEAASASERWVVFGKFCRVASDADFTFIGKQRGAVYHGNKAAHQQIMNLRQELVAVANQMRAALGLPPTETI